MPRFNQTVAPIGTMMTIWFKLSIVFGIVTFFEMLLQTPDIEEKGYQGWSNVTEAYKKWTDHAVCKASPVSQFLHEYLLLSELMLAIVTLFILGALRAGLHIVLPYYLTTAVIEVWS